MILGIDAENVMQNLVAMWVFVLGQLEEKERIKCNNVARSSCGALTDIWS